MSNNSAAQAELNRIHNLIGAKPLLPGQNSKGIVFAIPNPRGFTTGVRFKHNPEASYRLRAEI